MRRDLALYVDRQADTRHSRGPPKSSTAPWCYTGIVPTRYKRVSVTLTPPLQAAREGLRRRGLDPSVGELAIAGARVLLADAESQDDRQRKGHDVAQAAGQTRLRGRRGP